MLKKIVSIIGGIIISLVISYFTLSYDGHEIHFHDRDGNRFQIIQEPDTNLMMNGLLIVLGTTLIIYLVWTFIEKKVN